MKLGGIGIRTKIIIGDAATWYLVKKYVDGATVNPDETYDFLDKVYALTKITKTKKKQRLVYVHIAEYCIERLAELG